MLYMMFENKTVVRYSVLNIWYVVFFTGRVALVYYQVRYNLFDIFAFIYLNVKTII
jgi:hypothetical protein